MKTASTTGAEMAVRLTAVDTGAVWIVGAYEAGMVVALRGELDIASVQAIEAIRWAALARRLVVLDLNEVEFLDVTCLGAMLKLRGHLRSGGGDLVLRGARPAVRRLLEITALNGLLEDDAPVPVRP